MGKSIHAHPNSGSFTQKGVWPDTHVPSMAKTFSRSHLGVTLVSSSVGWSILQVVKV